MSTDNCKSIWVQNWKNLLECGQQTYNIQFEHAIFAILNGNLGELNQILESNPNLVNSRSSYGHRATLLHYVASNGIEIWRQQVPLNLVKAVQLLIDSGVNKEKTMDVYGGKFTALQLLQTSDHPNSAGIAAELIDVLINYRS